MLTPMMAQYLVGLCCLRRNGDAVEVTIGDLVLDTAAEKERDVDITVTLQECDGRVRAFKAYEVKREHEPLDVAAVEQLCIKLRDMPSVTHRAIVSASGFTDGAIAKAGAHDVQLFAFKPWTAPLADQFPEFDGVGAPDQFLRQVASNLLFWVDARLNIFVPEGPPSFNWCDSTRLVLKDGTVHKTFPTAASYRDALLLRSTQLLFALEPAQTVARTFPAGPMADNEEFEVSPTWPHTHTLGVLEDGVFLKFDGGLAAIHSVTISGYLQWQKRKRAPEFYILEAVPTHEVFAGAAVADWGNPEGRMFGMIFAPDSRAIHIHPKIQLQDKHKNAIRRLKVRQPNPGSG